ncbi:MULTISPECIES: hypothetical protein [Flavobacteriaceae]|uniref:hypothetical protein n=1 Tax=Flavobacteriaceae TaxID=49546 RepID=UPI00234A4032|nr:hypothetical protein [Muricauda sp. SP22]MDC6362485.1 hypothetical protein [Muricauda sp. SP22]
MKRIVFSSVLIAGLIAVLGHINAAHYGDLFRSRPNSGQQQPMVYSAKFKECIAEEDFPVKAVTKFVNAFKESGRDMEKVEASIKKYGSSLDSTLKNLSYIDAHDFLHKQFQHSKDLILNHEISEIQEHYHREIMRLCYENDRLLNLDSDIGAP